MICQVMIEGRLCWDARSGKAKTAWANFRLAHRKGKGEESKVVFVDVHGFGKLATELALLKKGDHVLIRGKLDQSEKKLHGHEGILHTVLEIEASEALKVQGLAEAPIDDLADEVPLDAGGLDGTVDEEQEDGVSPDRDEEAFH